MKARYSVGLADVTALRTGEAEEMGRQTSEGHEVQGGFFVPCLLLMVGAGYADEVELAELLTAFGFHSQAGGLGAMLDRLEADGLLHRGSESAGDGPSGRPCRLTPAGEDWLAARREWLDESARLVRSFLDRYAAVPPPSDTSPQ